MSTGRSYAGVAPEDRAARRRQQLLDAGLELFGTAGYRKTTVRQLCREARVADRYFYEEFPSTEDLLLAVYNGCLDRLQASVLAAVGDLDHDVQTLARAGLTAFFREVETDSRLARVVWFEVLGVSERVEDTHLRRTNEFGELLVALLSERGMLDTLDADDRRVVLSAVVGGISQVVLNWVNDGFHPARAKLVKPLTGFLIAGATVSSRKT